MTRFLAIALSSLLVACSQASLSPSPTPTACPAPSATASATASSALTCRIPVAEFSGPPGQPGSRASYGGGFLELPGASLVSDPSAEIERVADPTVSDLWQTLATPTLHGRGGLSYDAPLRRWVPVPSSQVSPDGREFAYDRLEVPPGASPGAGPIIYLEHIRVVDVATGEEHVIPTPSLVAPGVIAFAADGIYLSEGCPEGCPAEAGELWRADARSNALTKVTSAKGTGWLIDREGAWTAIQPDPSMPSWKVVRIDLVTAQVVEWLTDTPPCSSFCRPPDMIAIDSESRPLIEVWRGDSVQLQRLSTPGQPESLFAVSAQSQGVPYFEGVRDAHGIWLGSRSGLFLVTDSGVQKMSPTPGIVTGPCVSR